MAAKELAQKVYECFGKGDLAGVLALLDENIIWELVGPLTIPYFGRYVGQKGVEQFFSALFEHEEILDFVPEKFIEEGDTVVVLGRERCRSKKTSKEFSVQWAQVFNVRNNKIISWSEHIDTAPMVAVYV